MSAAISAGSASGAAFWADAESVLLDVQASLGDGFKSLVQGYVDSVTLDPVRGVAHLPAATCRRR